jgi:hypothetical protein
MCRERPLQMQRVTAREFDVMSRDSGALSAVLTGRDKLI